jgi:hypothetical protein
MTHMLTLVVSKLENNIIYDVLKPLTHKEGFFILKTIIIFAI